jgi:hypothetical protein
MKIKSLLLVLFLGLTTVGFAQEKKTLDNVANDQNKADFKFESEEFNFGNIAQGESATYDFKFTNNGNEPLIISKAEGSCGCTVPIWPKEPIMKGQSGTIKVTFNSAGKMGIQDKTVTLTSNAKQNPIVLHMKGTVEKAADPTVK